MILHGREPAFLDDSARVPTTHPFTRAQAISWGVADRELAALTGRGLLLHPIKGVYYAAQLADGIDLRLACLQLVVPPDAVVTDRTAGWLHGASMILAPNDHLVVPSLSVFCGPGLRLRGKLVASGERRLRPRDVETIDGIRVTTALRTACDLGRLLHRDQGIAAMDALARTGLFELPELTGSVERFKGMRGVCQLRYLAPYVDPRAQSPAESILRLRWWECPNLPAPEPQIPVLGPDGPCYLDLGVEALRYAIEYDGVEWHGPEQREHDEERREWLRRMGWHIDVVKRRNLFGAKADVDSILIEGIAEARRRAGQHFWRGVNRRQSVDRES